MNEQPQYQPPQYPAPQYRAPEHPGPQVQPTPQPPRRSGAATAVLVATSVVGGLALLGVGVSNAVGAVVFNPQRILEEITSGAENWDIDAGFDGNDPGTDGDGFEHSVEGEPRDGYDAVFVVPADGIDGIALDIAASSFTLEFGDVEDAELAVTGRFAEQWWFGQQENDLVVESPSSRSGFDARNSEATLTLPESLRDTAADPEDGLDLEVELAAGQAVITGAFAEAELLVQAGQLRFDGAAHALDVDVQAGEAIVTAANVEEIDVDVEAGAANVTVTGQPPTSVSVDVELGEAVLTLPQAGYRVVTEADLGEVHNSLEIDPQAPYLIEVRASVGSATLRPGA